MGNYTGTQPIEPQEPNEQGEAHGGIYRAGEYLFARYKILSSDVRGSFGVVYIVVDEAAGRKYAVKTFKPEYSTDAFQLAKFIDEVSFWLQLAPHLNIVKAHFVEQINQQPFLFLEYIPGEKVSLRDRLGSGQPLPIQLAIRFAYQFILGMEFANHNGEIAHLDLKPENLLIGPGEVLKITDFGLSERINVMQGKIPRLSQGSWPYASPERLKRKGNAPDPFNWIRPNDKPAEDSRSDIFTFGLIFYEMVTGGLPYPMSRYKASRDYGKLANFYIDAFYRRSSFKSLPRIVQPIVSTCLSIDPAERFRDFTHLRRMFEQAYKDRFVSILEDANPAQTSDQTQAENNVLNQARSLYRVGRYREALAFYNRILIKEPFNSEVLLETATVLKANKQRAAALFLLRNAVEKHPELEAVKKAMVELEDENATAQDVQ